MIARTAEDSQPKTQSRSSRSLSVTVSSRETPSCGSRGEDSETLIHTAADPLQRHGQHRSHASVAPTTPSLYTRMLISLWAARSKMSLAATLQVILSVSKNMSLWRRCPALFTPGAGGQQQLLGNQSNRRCSSVWDSASSFLLQRPERLLFFFFFWHLHTRLCGEDNLPNNKNIPVLVG